MVKKRLIEAAVGAIKGIILIKILEDCGFKYLDVKQVIGKEDELWIKIKLPKQGGH